MLFCVAPGKSSLFYWRAREEIKRKKTISILKQNTEIKLHNFSFRFDLYFLSEYKPTTYNYYYDDNYCYYYFRQDQNFLTFWAVNAI